MKKVLALLLAMVLPLGAPALAECSHPADKVNTWEEPTGVRFEAVDSARHEIIYEIGRISTCTACDGFLSLETVREESEYEDHQFDPETNYCNTCGYTYKAAKPTKVILDESGTVTLPLGEVLSLDWSFEPAGAASIVKWSTSSKKVATVVDGVVTPVKEGTATITVKTANGKKDTVKVKVVDPTKPAKVELNLSGTVTLNIDQTLTLDTIVSPETASGAQLKWSTSSKKIATVADGVVTPVKEGTATITVKTANGKKDTVKVKVVDPYKPSKITIAHGQGKLETGSEFAMQVTLKPETARATITWKSSNTKVAKVDAEGNVTLVGAGSATITAKTQNGKTAKVKLSVSEKAEVYVTPSGEKFHLESCPTIQNSKKITGMTVKKAQGKGYEPCKVCKPGDVYALVPTEVSLDDDTVVLALNQTLALEWEVEPEEAETSLTWKTSSKKVATVDENGVVTPMKEGTATITVTTHNGKKDTVKVKVVDPNKIDSIKIDKTGTQHLKVGNKIQIYHKISPETAQTTLTWKSSDTSVAIVSEDGLVTAVGDGTATVTVSTHNGKTASVKISVTAAEIENPVGAKELSGYLGKPFSSLKKVVSGLKSESGGKDGYVTKEFYKSGSRYNFWGFLSTGNFSNPDYITAGWKKDVVFAIETQLSGYALHGFYVGMPQGNVESHAEAMGYTDIDKWGSNLYFMSGKKSGDVRYDMMIGVKNGKVTSVRLYAVKDGYWYL